MRVVEPLGLVAGGGNCMTPSPAQRERPGVRVVEPLGLVAGEATCMTPSPAKRERVGVKAVKPACWQRWRCRHITAWPV